MQNKQNLKNRDLFIARRGVGVWELKYQTRQSEKMLRGCKVVHLGVIGSNIAGISHVHQKPLPPLQQSAWNGLLGCSGGVCNGWVSKMQPHSYRQPHRLCWQPCQCMVLPILTTLPVFSGPCSGNMNPSEQKPWSSLLNCWYYHMRSDLVPLSFFQLYVWE